MTADIEGHLVPYEILVEIFSGLPFADVLSAGAVCQLWHAASCDVLQQRRAFCVDGASCGRAAPVLARAAAPLQRLVLREADVLADGALRQLWSSAGPGLLELRLLGCTVKEPDFEQILSMCPNLVELALVGCDSLFMAGNIFKNSASERIQLPQLKSLDLSCNRYLSDAILEKFLALSPRIESLSVAGCQIGFHPGIYKKFYPGGAGGGAVSTSVLTFQCLLSFLTSNATRISTLDISDTNVDDAALLQLAALHELQLTRLVMSRCRSVSDTGLASFLSTKMSLTDVDLSGTRASDATVHVLALNPLLMHLALRQCDRLTASSLAPLSNTRLLSLDVGGNERLPPDAVTTALPSYQGSPLKSLSLRAAKFSADTLVASVRRLPALTSLDLSRCLTAVNDTSVQAICQCLRSLEVLRLAECRHVTDSGLTGLGLGNSTPRDPPRPNKTFLHGNAQAAPPAAPRVMDSAQRANPQAISLQSRHERQIWSDAERKKLVQRQIDLNEDGSGVSLLDISGLRELDLSQCGCISDVSVGHVIRFSTLRWVNMSHCAQLGSAGVSRLGRHCPALETVTLANLPSLDDEGLEQLLKHTPRLKHLNISCCTALTDRSLRAIADVCQRLQYLDVSGCGLMSSSRAADLEETMPQLATVLRQGLDGSAGQGAQPPPAPPLLPSARRR